MNHAFTKPSRSSLAARVLLACLLGVNLGLAGTPQSALGFTMQGAPSGRSLDVPRRISELRRDLKIGQLWLTQLPQQPMALRASLESGNRIVAALTLNPNTGLPVPVSDRSNYRVGSKPSLEQLSAYLTTLRANAEQLRFGAFAIPAPQGVEIQVYWQSKLVSYVYLNPSNFEANTDERSSKEVQLSAIRVK